MRTIKILAHICLWTSCGLFLYTFLISSYRLKKEYVSEQEAWILSLHAPKLFTETFRNHIHFRRTLAQGLRRYTDRFKITTADEAQLASKLPATNFIFRKKFFDKYEHRDIEVMYVKRDMLKKHGQWLEGKEYNSRADCIRDLKVLKSKITANLIAEQQGLFKSYERENFYTKMLRAASQDSYFSRHITRFTTFIFSLLLLGTALYFLPYALSTSAAFTHNNLNKSSLSNRGWLGWLVAGLLITFYVCLYFYPSLIMPWVVLVDPISKALNGGPAGHFFLYGLLYCLAVGLMGVRMLLKHRHSPYHKLRTCSLIFFQLVFAFLLPELLVRMNKPYFDFKNIWPLDYDFFFETELSKLTAAGGLGIFMLGWGIGLILVGVPVLTYFFGKRWYCSWVCGCGGLAETLGDSYRQLSNKSTKAWKIERWTVHSVLIFAVCMTIGVLYTYWSEKTHVFGLDTYNLRYMYGFFIGALFSGVIGTGFYPLMGSRVWCRFGCPLAAYLGIIQRFKSRFRITTNGGQCISCGNCSTYCEMGIDVRHYAQRGQAVVRASCVGCGVCATVCPRGVLRLETKSTDRSEANLLGLQKKYT